MSFECFPSLWVLDLVFGEYRFKRSLDLGLKMSRLLHLLRQRCSMRFRKSVRPGSISRRVFGGTSTYGTRDLAV